MITGLQQITPALARAWVRLYTSGMPPDLRDARRAEVDADLWEHQKDASDNGDPRATTAAEILLRTILGIPDDMGWRLESINAQRVAAIDGRIGTMAISVRQMRWMGLCALLGGALMAGGNLVDAVLGHPGRVYTSDTAWHLAGTVGTVLMSGGAVVMLLCSLGVVALYVQQRGRAGKAGSAGFTLILTGFACILTGIAIGAIFGVSGGFGVLLNILVIPGTLMIAPGFLLLGMGMPNPFRRVPLILGWFGVAQTVLALGSVALRSRYPSASLLLRSDSSVGVAFSILFGLGLAVIGYSIWSGTSAVPGPEANR